MSRSICKRLAMIIAVATVVSSFSAFAFADNEQVTEPDATVSGDITEETKETSDEEVSVSEIPAAEGVDEGAPEEIVLPEETEVRNEEEQTPDAITEAAAEDDTEVKVATGTVAKYNDAESSKPLFHLDTNPYADKIPFLPDLDQGVEFTGIPDKVKAYRVYTNSHYNSTIVIPLTTEMLNKYVFRPTRNNTGSDYIIFWLPFDRNFELNGKARDYDLGQQSMTDDMKFWAYDEATGSLSETSKPAGQYYCYKIPVNGGALNKYKCQYAYPLISDYNSEYTDAEQTLVKESELPDPSVVKIYYQKEPEASCRDYTPKKPAQTNAGSYTYKYRYWPADGTKNLYFNILDDSRGGSIHSYTATIDPATIKVYAEDASKYEYESDPKLEYNCSGLPAGCRAVEGELAREAGEKPGTYDITQGSLKIDDNNYTLDFTGAKFEVKEIVYKFTKGNGDTWTKESGKDLTFKVSCNYKDDEAIDRFIGVSVDGEDLDDDQYTAKAGSVILTLKADYLETLDAGKHTIEVEFEHDKTATAKFTIENAPEPSPQTGDGISPFILVIAGLMTAAGAAFVYKAKKAL